MDRQDDLTFEAEIIRGIALAFPQFQVPGKQELWELQAERMEKSKYRHFGLNRVQDALNELRDLGFYGWRRVTQGRQAGGEGTWAYARSFSDEPWQHLVALEALTADEIRAHHLATKTAWALRVAPGATR